MFIELFQCFLFCTSDCLGPFRTALAGGIGGMALWAAIFPADVIKSRMQVSGKGSFGSLFLEILKKEGRFTVP